MSKRIIYKKRLYVQAEFEPASLTDQVDSLARAVIQLARYMDRDEAFPVSDNVVQVLGLVKNAAFKQLRRR